MTPKSHITFKQVQSLLEFIRSAGFQPYFLAAFILWLVGAVEIVQKTGGQRLDPRFWMLVAVVITIYCGIRAFCLTPRRQSLSGKTKSPRATEIVNRIHSNGFAVYQDPTETSGDGYVIVGPAGIYAVEVKERNVFGSRTIEFGGDDKLVLGGRIADSRPVKQAQLAAQKIREGLKGVIHKGLAVKPLVVFLNDWRINRQEQQPNVPVLSGDELPQYLNGQEPILSQSEIAEISSYLNQTTFAAAC